jgi:starch synthase
MQNLWIFSFEYAGIIKVGGLGEVPANQTKWLASQYNITLFMPSHGVHQNLELRKKLQLVKLPQKYQGVINAQEMGLGNDNEIVEIDYYKGTINGIQVILLVGANTFSSNILDDPIVYSSDTLSGKFVLFSLGVKSYVKSLLEENEKDLPHIIHCHDHHGVPALICCRQALIKEKKDVATLITIHLLSWPRYSYEFLLICGAENIEFDIFVGGEHKSYNLMEFYEFCKGSEISEPSLEKIGVFFADVVTSVSEDYALSNVVGNLGGGWIYPKTSFIWNGCDWDYESIRKSVLKSYEQELKILNKGLNDESWVLRRNLRKFLLTRAFSQLNESEPVVESRKVQSYLHEKLRDFPFIKDRDGVFRGKLANFFEDGPLIITTGRISKQKGIDVLLDAVPLVLKEHPDAKFIFSVLPTEFTIPDIESYLLKINQYKDNIRMIFGKVESIFMLMHIAADIYCAPSRWEPFGITGLEASITKNLVVASQTGGLQEIVLDVKKAKENATGILVPIENVEKLADAICDLISAMKIEELSNYQTNLNLKKISRLNQMIKSEALKNMVEAYSNYTTMLRENAFKRVEKEFRWKKVTKKLPKLYDQALYNRGIKI